MEVNEHYKTLLGPVYSWMTGDFAQASHEALSFLRSEQIHPESGGIAIDAGAGHGIYAHALATAGFSVKAIDTSEDLLAELRKNCEGMPVLAVCDDIRNLSMYAEDKPEVILCMGDTLAHLHSREEVDDFIRMCVDTLGSNGKLVLSFRDYSKELTGTARFIPVRSDNDRILTCFLEYAEDHVDVTDQLYTRTGEGWVQKISSYRKVRLTSEQVVSTLVAAKLEVVNSQNVKGMATIIARKS
jgi:SAM-dependent methyltransferase